MSVDQEKREQLKNLPSIEKVRFLVKRKMVLQAQLGNMYGRSSRKRAHELREEIKTIDELIIKHR